MPAITSARGYGASARAVYRDRAPKMSELIAAHLRHQIVSGELRAGDTLPAENELLTHFDVSRPTLREAFRILEAESLLIVRRGNRGGAEVTVPDLSVAARHVGVLLQLSGTTIEDVHEARAVLEPAAARMLALRRTDQDLADLRDCIENLRAATEEHTDPFVWFETGYVFHDLVVERAGNRTLAIEAGILREVITTHVAAAISRTSEEPQTRQAFRKTIRAYTRLVSLIEARDAPGAEEYWRKHMEVSARILLRDARARMVVDLFD
ncbi:transcriptional regulator, GntR family [Frankia torreyi]|uniref:Transcriptional regulator, GntR family n=3 Tax=Frankiaceae TaxID=74712 RepID=A0A0D8B6T9_9ACTN|nr:transcriptional regulator, GntR family [Frankia torreyi]KQC37007.1 GntR family transcriptional regulator [Frankia sp. ACN1ag]